MTIELEAGEAIGPEVDLRPSLAILIGGACAIGLISALSLPWPMAVASTMLGMLMIAGADIDARTFLLPDLITMCKLRFPSLHVSTFFYPPVSIYQRSTIYNEIDPCMSDLSPALRV